MIVRYLILPTAIALIASAFGCGVVKDHPNNENDGSDASHSVDGSVLPDAPPDACVSFVRVSVQFTVTNIAGTGSSSIEVMLGHSNGYVIDIPMWTEERGIHALPTGSLFKTVINAASWTIDYTGQDEGLLDVEVRPFLTTGFAFRHSVFDIANDKSVFVGLAPVDSELHPSMTTSCKNAPFMTDLSTNFPIPRSFSIAGCTVIFFDFRGSAERKVIASGSSTLELSYSPCQ